MPLPSTPAVILATAFAASVVLRVVASSPAEIAVPPARAGLPSSYARMMALSFDSLLADALWIRYIHSIPVRPAEPAFGRWLGSYLETVVTLDPNFKSAYISGGTLLAVLGNQPCSALKIAERGTRYHPEDWRVHFQAGFLCFDSLNDARCAARHMRAAAALPRKPEWLPGFVARLLSEQGRTDAAIEYLQAEITRTKDEKLRKVFEERLGEARLTRELDRLDKAARRFHLERGRPATSPQELFEEGYLSAPPVPDPFGGQYLIDESSRVTTTSGRGRLRTNRLETIYSDKNPRERIFWIRVEARLPQLLDNPAFLAAATGRLRGAAGDVRASAEALQLLRRYVPDSALTEQQRQQVLARILIRHEIDALRDALIEWQKEEPGRRVFTIEELARRAAVAATDPVGDPYVFDESGWPVSDRRPPMVSAREDRQTGSAGCL